MNIDLNNIPFSRYGAYLAISYMTETEKRPAGLYLRSVHGGHNSYAGPSIRLDLLVDGEPVPFESEAKPALLTLAESRNGRLVQICMPQPNLLRIHGDVAGLRLTFSPGQLDYLFQVDPDRWQFNCASWDLNLMFTVLSGRWQVDAPWQITRSGHIVIDLLPVNGDCEAIIEEVEGVWQPRGFPLTFDEDLATVQMDYQRWLDHMPDLPAEYSAARELAAYITWSSMVEPLGHITWPAMLMSKNWMNSVWSWDHCFNAMALTYKKPVLAWDQIRVIFDQQDIYGALPDLVNDRTIITSFVKPPIHGFTLRWMMERTSFIRKEQLHQIYGPLCRWTEWWFSYRDYDHDGIPQYHHGNDSGWDNCTVFEVGMPLESPDLCAYLVLQMEALARIAERLGNMEEAESWQRRSEELLEKTLAHFWQGDHFVALRSGDHLVSDTDSLFLFLPLVLGKRLPQSVRHDLLAGLTRPGRFLTPYGLATESLQSPKYDPDGYWRGPIWAPSTFMIVQGLAESGEADLAREVAKNFCDMCAASGFAENFDAQTGQGLRDRAYTWTASVFLVLAHEYLLKK